MTWDIERSKIRGRAAVKNWLKANYPEHFCAPNPKPFCYTVRHLLHQHAFADGVWLYSLDGLMSDWVNDPHYLAMCAGAGSVRYSLSGQPIERVSASDQAYARRRLKELRNK